MTTMPINTLAALYEQLNSRFAGERMAPRMLISRPHE